ncbi:HupE/UreJ family protein [Acinetobacter sp. YH12239]|uniref:HupE/UreJ family protein n=1 Tax=Acinetobacter sp. YH12239 TaxID=2601166 RepID=UPI0015D454AB|nr:HupE/UreJ family protein [Acinetobacter sp. YH12239]
MNMIKKIALMSIWFVSGLAFAHPGHHHHDASFWTGFIHPFTGLDHLMMALSFGVLMWSMSKIWKMIGAWGLLTALVAGFSLGAHGIIPTGVAEIGIVGSLFILAVSLWTKSNGVFPIAAVLLSVFHGSAHGAELAMNGNVGVQILGMITAMAMIYALGLGLGALMVKFVPQGKKIVGVLAALVAVIGLA